MDKPKFSIVLITKNEEKVIARCLESLSEFFERGGECIVVDTGSSDDTMRIAASYGAVVSEYMGAKKSITDYEAHYINSLSNRYLEPAIVLKDETIFDFSDARNYATSLAKNDFIISLDADEVYSKLDIDKINQLIDEGVQNISYDFVYSFTPEGKPDVSFVQSKAFDRRKYGWVNVIHEVLHGNGRHQYVDSSVMRLEHYQEAGKEHRGNYLKGLAYDHIKNPRNDRNAHYYARELMYTKRYKSAIDKFDYHRSIATWDLERNQSLVYMADCYGYLGQVVKQEALYIEAIQELCERREPFIKLAWLYFSQKKYRHAIAFASAALTIPLNSYYSNRASYYAEEPHEILYLSHGWLGEITQAQHHITKCLEYKPNDPKYLDHRQYYF